MKYMKMLGLAAAAVMALMAFFGAGSASATVLCTTKPTKDAGGELTCPKGWDYAAGTKIHETQKAGTSAILETLGGSVLVTCTESTITTHTLNTGGKGIPIVEPITKLVWGSATTPCTKTVDTLKEGELEVSVNSSGNGTVVGKGSEVTINTIFGSCVYGSSTGIDFGEEIEGAIAINAIVPKISGNATCPSEARWTANYVTTEPHKLYVASYAD